ncbi:MAG: hypothetical protein WED04_07130 [Promethearchaeati archaeon SRVP18_Atabeyarchaeia-1]
MKEKIKKAGSAPPEGSVKKEEAFSGKRGTGRRENGASDLTEKLKAAFHEEQKEDPELRRKKELEQTIRDYRKSFRQDVATGVKQQVGGVVAEVKQQVEVVVTGVKHQMDGVATEVKRSITNMKEASRAKKRERDDEESSDES